MSQISVEIGDEPLTLLEAKRQLPSPRTADATVFSTYLEAHGRLLPQILEYEHRNKTVSNRRLAFTRNQRARSKAAEQAVRPKDLHFIHDMCGPNTEGHEPRQDQVERKEEYEAFLEKVEPNYDRNKKVAVQKHLLIAESSVESHDALDPSRYELVLSKPPKKRHRKGKVYGPHLLLKLKPEFDALLKPVLVGFGYNKFVPKMAPIMSLYRGIRAHPNASAFLLNEDGTSQWSPCCECGLIDVYKQKDSNGEYFLLNEFDHKASGQPGSLVFPLKACALCEKIYDRDHAANINQREKLEYQLEHSGLVVPAVYPPKYNEKPPLTDRHKEKPHRGNGAWNIFCRRLYPSTKKELIETEREERRERRENALRNGKKYWQLKQEKPIYVHVDDALIN